MMPKQHIVVAAIDADFTPRHLPVWRLTVAKYHQMLEIGILHSGDPVELLEGVLVEKHGADPAQFVAVDGEFPPLPIWRLTVEQFDLMRAAGIIQRNDPVELVDGFLVSKTKCLASLNLEGGAK